MKQNRLLLLIAAIMLLSAITVSAAPIPIQRSKMFNFPNLNTYDLVQYVPLQMMQGWENNQQAWFVATDASDLQLARLMPSAACLRPALYTDDPTFAPRLADLAGQVAIMYVVTNLLQGPVFTAAPGDATYSGLWQVVYVTYKPGALKHYVTNADPYDAMANPTGLPSAADASFSMLNKSGLPVVVKYPIMALGRLGGPWTPSIPGEYRIPQGKVQNDYTYTKIIWLPFWAVYCKDPITKKNCVDYVAIPDAFDPVGLPIADQLVPKLGANNAPGLGLINPVNTQAFYWQLGPQPLTQFPIMQACPTEWLVPCLNQNYAYTPVETVVVLQRNVPPLPAATVINNEMTLLNLEGMGFLTQIRDTQVINATVLPTLEIKIQ